MRDFKGPNLPLTGGCACGAIRYEITAMPLSLYACHCTDCQQRSGSAFALNMPLATASLKVTQGQPRGWRHVSPSGAAVVSRFCAECGCRIYGERAGRPETVNLRAGTLDDTSWLRPAAHFFTRSAQPWEIISSERAACFETEPDDTLSAASSAWRKSIGGNTQQQP